MWGKGGRMGYCNGKESCVERRGDYVLIVGKGDEWVM
jgi:hypothetical protein